jgi:hypothetical protein
LPKTFEEQKLRFVFDDSWSVVKYDDHPDYQDRIRRLDETKALDFVAVYANEVLYLIEVKDFRGYRIKNRPRVRDAELALEVGQKVRDTIAGIVAAHHRGNTTDWGQAVKRLGANAAPVRVLLWLEQDLPPGPRGRRMNELSVLIDALKQRLDWLTPRVLVVDLKGAGAAPDGLVVSNLPGAGQAP